MCHDLTPSCNISNRYIKREFENQKKNNYFLGFNTCLYGHANQMKDSQLLKKSSVTLYLLYGKILRKALYSFLYLYLETQVVSEIGGHIWPMDQNKDRTSYKNMWQALRFCFTTSLDMNTNGNNPHFTPEYQCH